MTRLDDALDGLSSRELEAMRERIDRRLRSCAIDGADGAIPVRGVYAYHGRGKTRISLLLCPACIERHRLPESRTDEPRGLTA